MATNAPCSRDLENGVSSLWLVVGGSGLPVEALADVLDDVYLDLAPVTLDAGADVAAAADALLAVHEDKGIPASEVRGNLGADPLGLRARTGAAQDLDGAAALAARIAEQVPETAHDRRRRPAVPRGGRARTLRNWALPIATGVAYLRALTDAGPVRRARRPGSWSSAFAATADQFGTIAKLRAARRLWARVAEVCGAPGAAVPPARRDLARR